MVKQGHWSECGWPHQPPFVLIAKRMLCDRCQSKEAMVHITTILHVWFGVDRERAVAGPTVGEDHLCAGCAQTTLAANPRLNPRTDALPAIAPHPVMSKTLRRMLDRMDRRHRPRLAWRPALRRLWKRRKSEGQPAAAPNSGPPS